MNGDYPEKNLSPRRPQIDRLNKPRGNSATESMQGTSEEPHNSQISGASDETHPLKNKRHLNSTNNAESFSEASHHSLNVTPPPVHKRGASVEVSERVRGSTVLSNPPAEQGIQEEPAGEVVVQRQYWKCVCEKLRLSCSVLCILLSLTALVVVILWFTTISTRHPLPTNHTTVVGLLPISPSNTLIQGGAEVTLNLSTLPESMIKQMRARIYYGPQPSWNEAVLKITQESWSFVATNTSKYYTMPLVFEMRPQSGSFDYTFSLTSTAYDFHNREVFLHVYSTYDQAISHDEGCRVNMTPIPGTNDQFKLQYLYSYGYENCLVSQPSSQYKLNRYFTISVRNTTQGPPNLVRNVTVEGVLAVHGGSLNRTLLNDHVTNCKLPDTSQKVIKCFVQYATFVDEIGADNTILVDTFLANPNDIFFPATQTIISLDTVETVRVPDVLGLMIGIVVLLALIVLSMYICPKKERRKIIFEHPCTCLAWCVRHRRVRGAYQVLAGEH